MNLKRDKKGLKKNLPSQWKKLIKKNRRIVNVSDITFPKFSIKYSKENPNPDGITQSIIQAYLKCRREFLFRLNKWGSEQKRTHFANGSITHDTLDKCYTFYKKKKKLPKSFTIKKWINDYDKDHPKWLPTGNQDAELYKAVCYVIITEYLIYYKKDFKPGRIQSIEGVWDINWKGFRLRGKKDLTFNIKKRRWIMETKTSARINENILMQKLAFDFQNLFYVNAEESQYNINVAGVLYNIIRNPGLKFTETSLALYCVRLRKDIKKRPEHYFKRFEIPYTNIDKNNFKRELFFVLCEINDLLENKKRIPDLTRAYKNTRNCTGSFNCSFLAACSSNEMDGYIQVSSLFNELESN